MRQVVVEVTCRFEWHEGRKVFAARIRELGLTGYGGAVEQAISDVKEVFARFVRLHREKGTLERVLNSSDLSWDWRDEYPADGMEVEDVSDGFPGGVGLVPAPLLGVAVSAVVLVLLLGRRKNTGVSV